MVDFLPWIEFEFLIMAPKSKRSRGESSSSQGFDSEKFLSFEASERYVNVLQTRKFIPERGFAISERQNPEIHHMITARRWGKFCNQPSFFVSNLVREFYANVDKHRNGKVRVRGKTVSFDSATINKIYDLLDIPDSNYFAYFSEVNYDAVCNELCVPRTMWNMAGDRVKSVPGATLKANARAWQYFVSHKMMPVLHYSELTAERAVLIYAIMTGMTIDVDRVLFDSIIHTMRNRLGLACTFRL